MAATKLDDKAVRELAAPAAGNVITWDTEVKGFGVRVTAAGTKALVLDYRVKAGPKIGTQRRYTIGDISDWRVAAGRSEAKRIKRLVDQGHDPVGGCATRRSGQEIRGRCRTSRGSR